MTGGDERWTGIGHLLVLKQPRGSGDDPA